MYVCVYACMYVYVYIYIYIYVCLLCVYIYIYNTYNTAQVCLPVSVCGEHSSPDVVSRMVLLAPSVDCRPICTARDRILAFVSAGKQHMCVYVYIYIYV